MLPLCLALLPSTASSRDLAGEEAAPVDLELSVTAVSDYRYRGISLSDKEPALQGDLTVTHESGLYATLWASSIANNGGADIENQMLLGFSLGAGDFTIDVEASYYFYPGRSDDNYAEFAARLGRGIGPLEIGATVSYAPAQANIGSVDNLYLGLDGSVDVPGTPLSLTATLGFEDGAFGDEKLDWSLGLSGEAVGLTFGLSYVDTSHTFGDPLAKPTVVASITKTF